MVIGGCAGRRATRPYAEKGDGVVIKAEAGSASHYQRKVRVGRREGG